MHHNRLSRQWKQRLAYADRPNDEGFKRYLMICVIVSVVTLVAACNEQDRRSYCVDMPTNILVPANTLSRRTTSTTTCRSQRHTRIEWNCTRQGQSHVRFSDGVPVVQVRLPLPTALNSSPIVVEVFHHGGWSSKNTLLHLLACTSCLANAILLKNRTGYVAPLVWSGSLALFLVAIVADVATVMTWRHDCYLLGLVLADEVSNSVLQSRFSTLERASALQNATTECHVWPRAIGFTILFAATGCLCCGNIMYSLVLQYITLVQRLCHVFKHPWRSFNIQNNTTIWR